MSSKTVLIVGPALKSFRKYLIEHGYDYIVLRDKNTTKFPNKLIKRRVLCDFSSKETILEAVNGIKTPLNAVMATYESFILPAAQIAEHLGVPGLPVASAESCTDKELMRELFETSPEPISPDFLVVNNVNDLQDFAAKYGFPLILKPANLVKSLLVTKNHDLSELLDNYETTMSQIDAIYKRYAPHRKPKLLVEEFLEGSIHSVDAFVGADGEPKVLEQVVDYQTGYDIGYDDNFHYSRIIPTKLSKEVVQDIRHVAALGCKSLGIKNSAAHIEVILTKEGPRIVEIGARSGGYRERMHGLANGIDITGCALDIAFGRKPDITSKHNDSCAVLELFPKDPGIFKELAHEKELSTLSSLVYYDVKAPAGSFVGRSSDGYKMTAVIMLHNKDSQAFNNDLAWINKTVRVVAEPA